MPIPQNWIIFFVEFPKFKDSDVSNPALKGLGLQE